MRLLDFAAKMWARGRLGRTGAMTSRALLMMLVATGATMLVSMASAGAGCPLDAFGVRKVNTCSSGKCTTFEPPPEIAAIKRGLYGEMVGLFINDGLAEWIGVDLDTGEIVRVERYAGPHLGRAPRIATPSAQLSQRVTGQGRSRMVDTIRRAPLARDTAEDIVCAANDMWADAGPPPMSGGVTDMHLAVVLVDGTTRKSDGGPLGMAAAARAVHERLEALKAAAWPR